MKRKLLDDLKASAAASAAAAAAVAAAAAESEALEVGNAELERQIDTHLNVAEAGRFSVADFIAASEDSSATIPGTTSASSSTAHDSDDVSDADQYESDLRSSPLRHQSLFLMTTISHILT